MLKAVEIIGWWVVDGHAYLLQVPIIEGMIHTKDGFFGDWDFKDDDDAFWCWRRTVDVCAQLRLGLRVEDIEGSHELTRLSFVGGEKPDEYVGRMLITDPKAAIGVTLESPYTGDDAYHYRLKRSAKIGIESPETLTR